MHEHGGQVYRWRKHECDGWACVHPGQFGGDVSHLNLHKTTLFHMVVVDQVLAQSGVKEHLKPFMQVTVIILERKTDVQSVLRPFGSASILPIT